MGATTIVAFYRSHGIGARSATVLVRRMKEDGAHHRLRP